MKKFILLFIGVLFLMTLSFGSYKKMVSSKYQVFMLLDFNNNSRLFKLDDLSNLDLNFPNITVTSLPIKYLAARYLLENDSIETAKKLIHKSIKDNPYIYAPEILLASFYLSENKLDSALYYSERAFYGLTNNNRHREIYFNVLEELKDTISLDSAFAKIRNTNRSLDHWIDYVLTRNAINSKPSAELLNIIDEMTLKFPRQDSIRLNGVKRMVELEGDGYTKALYISELGNLEFQKGNYKEAAEFFEASIIIDDQQYLYFENAALSYDNLKEYSKAEEYFNKVIYEFKTRDGKSEFHKGLMLIKDSKDQLGCKYLATSARKNYVGINSGLNAVDVYMQLCQ
jgi:tetratricopeptide (TPR) repeat protein